ncbi:MAG: hypothetical protein Q8868_11860 [Bacteroidota bacterium]|nr:hypothetical protein [Bacteroidota bacterium]
MKDSDFKEFLIRSLDRESDPEEARRKIEEAGVTFGFREGFRERVLDKIYSTGTAVVREIEFVRILNSVFYRIALAGAAAVVILLVSMYLLQGSLNFNSFIGVDNSYNDSMISLLTGN